MTYSSKMSAIADPEGLTTIQAIKRPKTVVNHTYRDFSRVAPTKDGGTVENGDQEDSFIHKLHEILSNSKVYGEFISWRPHGRAFVILKPKQMETKVLGNFFDHSRYSTFLRQLKDYGFKQITQGTDRNCYYHEAFLRGLPHLLRFMPPPKTNRRRLVPDPDNEPDLFRISELFPLPFPGGAVGEGEDSKVSSLPTAHVASLSPDYVSSSAEVEKAKLFMGQPAVSTMESAADNHCTATSHAKALAANQVAAAQRTDRSVAAQQALLRQRMAAAAAADAVRREHEVAAAAAFSLVAAQSRGNQLDLARSIMLRSAVADGGGLNHPLSLPPAAAAAASSTAAITAALAGSPLSAARPPNIDAEALMSALAANAAVTDSILEKSTAAPHPLAGMGAAYSHLGVAGPLSALALPSAAAGSMAGAINPALSSAAALCLQQQQQHQRGGVGAAALYRGYP